MVIGLDKNSVLLNWANKINSLIERSRVAEVETLQIGICVGGLITNIGDNFDATLQKLESTLKNSRSATNGLSILEP